MKISIGADMKLRLCLFFRCGGLPQKYFAYYRISCDFPLDKMKFLKYNVECCYGGVAHLGERYIRIVEVVSSSLIVSTIV